MGDPAGRVPCDYWATSEVTRRLLADLGLHCEAELWLALDIDKCIFLAPRHPAAKEDTESVKKSGVKRLWPGTAGTIDGTLLSVRC